MFWQRLPSFLSLLALLGQGKVTRYQYDPVHQPLPLFPLLEQQKTRGLGISPSPSRLCFPEEGDLKLLSRAVI